MQYPGGMSLDEMAIHLREELAREREYQASLDAAEKTVQELRDLIRKQRADCQKLRRQILEEAGREFIPIGMCLGD